MRRSRYTLHNSPRLTRHSETEEASRNLKIRDEPIAEDETEAQRAMNNMASQLHLSIVSENQTMELAKRDA